MTAWLALVLTCAAGVSHADDPDNLARRATARSWLANSHPSAPTRLVNDGDLLTFWGSNEPTTDPPKDIGLEWPAPVECGCAIIRFYSRGYVPAVDGWQLNALVGGQWLDTHARATGTETEWWTMHFSPVRATALQLVVSRYAGSRPAVTEFEVYAKEPQATLRRPALLDGAFWQAQYETMARAFPTDQALADELDVAAAAGLKIVMLYTLIGDEGTFSTMAPGMALPQAAWWAGRDPLEAMLRRADALGMQVYLGDAPPNGVMAPLGPGQTDMTAKLNEYRRQLLTRYSRHQSLTGYYVNYEFVPYVFGNDPAAPAALEEQLAAFVKQGWPRLKVVAPVPLYHWRERADGPLTLATPDQLEAFWRPWFARCQHVDAFMVIDGVGTGLSNLNHTTMAQRRCRQLCTALGKEMWTDVEVAEMGNRYEPLPIDRVATSLGVAATHADTIVGFCYINYMSPSNGRPAAAGLYQDYLAYRRARLAGPATHAED